jgi:ATP-dependent DNA ligase
VIGRDSAVRADGPYARRRAVQPPRLGLRLEKVDGWRILAYKDGARVRLMSRNGVEHTRRFGDLAAAVSKLSGRSLVLDGEVAIYDLMAFDLLYRDGRDLSARPLRDRRARLEDVVAASNLVFPVRRLAPDGLEAWSQVVERGYEGIVAKDDGSPYEGGSSVRTGDEELRRPAPVQFGTPRVGAADVEAVGGRPVMHPVLVLCR